MLARLSVREGDSWYDLPIHGERFSIGRGQDNDHALATGFISRHHCELYLSDGVWRVRDLGSKLGTQINGKLVQDAPIAEGDILVLGNKFHAKFQLGMDRSQQPTIQLESTFVAPLADPLPEPPVTPAKSQMRLVALNGPLEGKIFPIEGEITRFGRHASCEVQIQQDTISQFHAELIQTPEGLVLADSNSSNGTYINDRRVHRQTLEPGDRIRLDWVAFRFEDKHYSVSNTGTRIRGNLLRELTIDGDDRDSQQYPELLESKDFAERKLMRDQLPSLSRKRRAGTGRLVGLLLLLAMVTAGGWLVWSGAIWRIL